MSVRFGRRYAPNHATVVIGDENDALWRFDDVDWAARHLTSFEEAAEEGFFRDLIIAPMESHDLITDLLRAVPAALLGNERGFPEFRNLGVAQKENRKWRHMRRELVHRRDRVAGAVASLLTEVWIRLVIAIEIRPAIEAALRDVVHFLRRKLVAEPVTPIVHSVKVAGARLPVKAYGVA